MQIDGWKYYNHAAMPTAAPHEKINMSPINNGSIWKIGGALLARWTTDFDCGYETNWWYVIKDDPFDVSKLKSKRRYVINQGIKNFEVKIINPIDYKKQLYEIQVAAFSVYPPKYRPHVDEKTFNQSIDNWNNAVVFGAFFRETGELCGYSLINEHADWAGFSVQKTNPAFEKYQINAALVYGILEKYNSKLGNNFYICDGEKNILHETAFQEYLEKYFSFRKAFCKLNLVYRKPIGVAVAVLMPFRRILNRLDGILPIQKISAVLQMDSICKQYIKEQRKDKKTE